MRHLQAYSDGADAYDRGESAKPPSTVPSNRRAVWLHGWADQKAFIERETARRKQTRRKPAMDPTLVPGDPSRFFISDADEIEMGGKVVRMTGSLPPPPEQLRRKP